MAVIPAKAGIHFPTTNLAGLVGVPQGQASRWPAGPYRAARARATTRPVRSRSGQSTRAFPHIRGAARSRPLGPRSSSMNGAELPLRRCVRGGLGPRAAPLVRERCFGLPHVGSARHGPQRRIPPGPRSCSGSNGPSSRGLRRAGVARACCLLAPGGAQFAIQKTRDARGRQAGRGTIPAPQAHRCSALTRWPRRCSSVVEQLIRNQQVVSSNLTVGSKRPKDA